MTNVKKNERYIPIKNYVLAVVIVVVMILLTLYGFAWYDVLKENRVSTSYLVREKIISNEIKGLDEVSAVFSEPLDTYFIYVSYTGSEEVYNMEKDLKKVINDYSLNDSMYFLNISDIKDEKDCIDRVNKALNLEEQKVKKVPTIIYYNDGKVVDIVERLDDNIMNVGDFEKLLETNKVTKE